MDSEVFRGQASFRPYRKSLPGEGRFLKRSLLDAVRFLEGLRPRPDLLHLHVVFRRSLYREAPLIFAARRLGLPVLADIRTGGLQYAVAHEHTRFENDLLWHALKEADALSVECEDDRIFVEGEVHKPVHVFPNTLSESVFERITPAGMRLQTGEPLKLVYTGRYIREKGLATWLEAMRCLSEEGIPVELHLIGKGDDAALNAAIASMVNNPPPHVRLVDHGWFEGELFELLAGQHVFCLVSSWPSEGHPFSLLEAMAAGLALIVSPWRHQPYLMPRAHAYLALPDDVASLVHAVRHYAEAPHGLVEAGAASREFVREHFLDSVTYPRLLDVYRDLAGRK